MSKVSANAVTCHCYVTSKTIFTVIEAANLNSVVTMVQPSGIQKSFTRDSNSFLHVYTFIGSIPKSGKKDFATYFLRH